LIDFFYFVASEKASNGLEEIQVDLKSKFQLFENFQHQEPSSPEPQSLGPVKKYSFFFTNVIVWFKMCPNFHLIFDRSASVLAKMARYQNGGGDSNGIGVSDEDFPDGYVMANGDEESSGDENEDSPDAGKKKKVLLNNLYLLK